MAEKRQIDKLRDSAFSFNIGSADDKSGITEIFSIDNKLHAVKKKSIYEISLPDEIDPGRTNIKLPPTQRCVLNYGSDDLYVQKILLTAKGLLRKNPLPPDFNEDRAMLLTFNCLKNLLAMQEIRSDLEKEEKRAERKFRKNKKSGGTLGLPSIPDLKSRVESYFQKANHVVTSLKGIVKIFYGNKISKKWINSLSVLIANKFGDDSPFAKFLSDVTPFLLLIINARNAIEHPNLQSQVIINDYKIGADGIITFPSVEVIHDETPLPPTPAIIFLKHVEESLGNITEILNANLCNAHVQAAGGFAVFVAEMPVERRRLPNVRYTYAIQFGEEVVPYG